MFLQKARLLLQDQGALLRNICVPIMKAIFVLSGKNTAIAPPTTNPNGRFLFSLRGVSVTSFASRPNSPGQVPPDPILLPRSRPLRCNGQNPSVFTQQPL